MELKEKEENTIIKNTNDELINKESINLEQDNIEIENVENPEYVTVTVNDEFLNRADFETTQGKENDTIEFLYFMGGGAF